MAGVYERNGQWLAVPKPIPLRLVVRSALLNALAYTDGHQGEAAARLEITPRQLGYILKTHGIPAAGRAGRPRKSGPIRGGKFAPTLPPTLTH